MMASIAGGTRVGRVCSVAFGLIAKRVGRVTRIAMVGCASGRTRTIELDTKGAKTRFIAPAYGKFESSSLQGRVRCELVAAAPSSRPPMAEPRQASISAVASHHDTAQNPSEIPDRTG